MTKEKFDLASQLLAKLQKANDLMDLFVNYAESNYEYIQTERNSALPPDELVSLVKDTILDYISNLERTFAEL